MTGTGIVPQYLSQTQIPTLTQYNPNIIGSQCSHDTIERDDMKEIHSQAQVLRGYILPICVTVVWRDHCATRGTFLITDKGAPFMG